MQNIGDVIVYGMAGVCKIATIESKEVNHVMHKYFVLKPVYNSSTTIYCPCDSEVLKSRMRDLLSIKEVNALIASMPAEPLAWIAGDTVRKEKYLLALQNGDHGELIRIIKTLHQRSVYQESRGKRLQGTDQHLFEEAERLLYEEFAYVLGIDPQDVLPFIRQSLEKSADKPAGQA